MTQKTTLLQQLETSGGNLVRVLETWSGYVVCLDGDPGLVFYFDGEADTRAFAELLARSDCEPNLGKVLINHPLVAT